MKFNPHRIFKKKKLYYYDNEILAFVEIQKFKSIFISLFLIIIGFLFVNIMLGNFKQPEKQFVTKTKIIEGDVSLIYEDKLKNNFSIENLRQLVGDYNFMYPDIVVAQAILESNHGKSSLFKSNNNLFGMRESKQRCTTNKGSSNNYAYYDNWVESVIDYGFYQSKYLSKLNRNQYFEYLSKNYAEDTSYVDSLKSIIKKYKL